jgi:UDPglucose--hexose-1-phosphate uridylyltransferase
MPEIRFNVVTKDWVIIAPERAKRPEDFIKKGGQGEPLPAFRENCPFCPGHEHLTPPETYRRGAAEAWSVRSIPNKFSALAREGTLEESVTGLKRTLPGVGLHDVIIESPLHNQPPALLPPDGFLELMKAYRDIYRLFYQDPRVKMVILFKNHGVAAGTSLEHPHSQIVGTPVIPPQIGYRIEESKRYFEDTGECLYCKILAEEFQDGDRIVVESEQFVSFVPYAALSPFHIWTFPKRHMASFESISEGELTGLSQVLREVLKRLYFGLDNPDYNLVLRSVPDPSKNNAFFHFYFAIVPRLTKAAGFELGSGMYINTQLPEKDAAFLREVRVPD